MILPFQMLLIFQLKDVVQDLVIFSDDLCELFFEDFLEEFSMLFNHMKDCSPLEVFLEAIYLFHIREVIASWIESVYIHPLLVDVVEILVESLLGSQLPPERKVITKLVRLHIVQFLLVVIVVPLDIEELGVWDRVLIPASPICRPYYVVISGIQHKNNLVRLNPMSLQEHLYHLSVFLKHLPFPFLRLLFFVFLLRLSLQEDV